ncbi:MAG: DUF1553 domain-containing protein, partial [Planctomycetaceae bacterium]
ELLSWLSRDFEAHGYDVKRLVRGLVLSRAYGLGSVAGGEVPAAAFAAAIERPLTGEQLARSWRVVAGVSAEDDGLRRKVTGALPDVLPREYAATWQQAQFLSGAAVLEELLRPEVSPTAARLSALSAVDERVRLAFQEVWGVIRMLMSSSVRLSSLRRTRVMRRLRCEIFCGRWSPVRNF